MSHTPWDVLAYPRGYAYHRLKTTALWYTSVTLNIGHNGHPVSILVRYNVVLLHNCAKTTNLRIYHDKLVTYLVTPKEEHIPRASENRMTRKLHGPRRVKLSRWRILYNEDVHNYRWATINGILLEMKRYQRNILYFHYMKGKQQSGLTLKREV
jgi:hypothetical protein